MKIITLCGSTKFKSVFEREMARLTLEANIVLSVGLFGHETGMDMNSDTKRMLDKMHFKKIDLADEIFVINPGGYIGLSTCDEIYYAIATGKKIKFLVDCFCMDEEDSCPICKLISEIEMSKPCEHKNIQTHSEYWQCKDCGSRKDRYTGCDWS